MEEEINLRWIMVVPWACWGREESRMDGSGAMVRLGRDASRTDGYGGRSEHVVKGTS